MPAIVVGAHYDVEAEPEGFVGANDGAAGTAAVVTLARALRRRRRAARRRARCASCSSTARRSRPAARTSSRAGCAARRPTPSATRGETRAFVLLDYIAEKHGLRFTREAVRITAVGAAAQRRARGRRRLAVLRRDLGRDPRRPHAVHAARRAPAIDLIDFDYPQRDSLDDDLDASRERSLDAVGEAVFGLVARLRRR